MIENDIEEMEKLREILNNLIVNYYNLRSIISEQILSNCFSTTANEHKCSCKESADIAKGILKDE